jgi:NTP pyrophosphatase (non-canonical NTP hydrolase)
MHDSDSLPSPRAVPLPEDRDVALLVVAETASARNKHKWSMERSTSERCLRILVAEVGEVADAIEELDTAENLVPIDIAKLDAAEQHLLDEIVQVASAAQRWATNLLRVMAASKIDPIVEVKRFFTFNDDGNRYTIVARDHEHALELLIGYEFGDVSVPFTEAKDEDGDPLALVEMTAEAVAKVTVVDDGARTSLSDCDIGSVYSTEH